MILHHGTDPVGAWRFSPVNRWAGANGVDLAFAWSVASLPPVLAVLHRRRLLSVDSVSIRPGPGRPRLTRSVSPLQPVEGLAAVLAEECPSQAPRDVRLDGVGEIDGAGVAVVRGLVDVYAYEAGGTGNVVVQTRCDAWLPFDLRGRPQRAVSDKNAPRLRAALEEIEDALGIQGQANKGKYSRCEGYTVVNLFEVGEEDEEPIDVFDYGLDESWFVTP